MNAWKATWMTATGVAVLAVAWTALGADGPARPVCESRQATLLEKYGDDGIDADADGILTRAEVRSYFDEKGIRGKRGAHRGKGRAMRGMGDMRGGPADRGPGGGRGLFRLIDTLTAETPPADFSLDRFPRADADGDGKVSQDEWTAFSTERRERLLKRVARHHPDADVDGDGAISDEELTSLRNTLETQHRERILDRHAGADADGDGVLSDEELAAFEADRLERRRTRILDRHPEADLDADGVLSDDEMRAFDADHPRRRGGPGNGMHRGRGMGRERGPGGRGPNPERMFECHPEADTNGDGELSPEEIEAFREDHGFPHRPPCGMGGPPRGFGDSPRGHFGPGPGCDPERFLERHPEADLDENGELSEEELEAFEADLMAFRRARILERHPEADLDGDGTLSDDELGAFDAERPRRRGGPDDGMRKGRGQGRGRGQHRGGGHRGPGGGPVDR